MRKYIGIFGIVILCTACSDSNNENSLASELDKVLQDVQIDATEFSEKLDELLTLEMASACASLPKEKAKMNYNKIMQNPAYHSIRYDWDSDRIRTIDIMGKSMEVPKANSVELSWVKSTTLDKFNFNYHNPTEKELENARNAMKAKEAELVKEGKVTEAQAGLADDLASSMIINYKVIDIPNLGDKAVWIQRKIGNELKVFYHGIEFQITVDLSDDESVNKIKSIKLAQQIINEKLR